MQVIHLIQVRKIVQVIQVMQVRLAHLGVVFRVIFDDSPLIVKPDNSQFTPKNKFSCPQNFPFLPSNVPFIHKNSKCSFLLSLGKQG